ncbi:MAG: periplasmic heavy metal sensor [Desulfobacteraceae bacterium]|jgi:Spy/CpxP family protein refolding chaperone|nr:periplasmic heavy metal sensor [Desulfobacteraceae bacterium]
MKARNLLILIVGIALVGFASTAMAGWGGGGHMGPGWHHRGGYEGGGPYGPGGYGKGGCGYGADLTDEQIQQIENERKAFFEATKEIRRDLRDKQLQLRRELDSENLDRDKAFQLQKGISDLRATLDQKRLEHRIAMQEISPDLGRGPDRGRGPGMGYGRGGYGGGPCWD